MNAMIFPYADENPVFEELFPDRSLCALPLAGKMAAEHWLDLCSLLRIGRVSVQDYSFDDLCRKALGDGERWSLKLQYTGSPLHRNLAGILEQHAGFLYSGPALVAVGAIFPDIAEPAELLEAAETVDAPEHLLEGIFLWDGIRFRRSAARVHRFGTLREYFELNFKMLSAPGPYGLPGYSAEKGVRTGMNVSIMPECSITPPVMLCDNIELGRRCVLSGGVIVGRYAIVDRDTRLHRSIVMDHTFVGRGMEFDRKIVSACRIIDPDSGAYADLDDGITTGTELYSGFDWLCAVEYLLALFFAVALAAPYLLCRIFFLFFRSPLWEYKLSLDRYPKFWRVLAGKCRLIRLPKCDGVPGVFRAAEGLSGIPTPEQIEIDDLFFQHNRTLHLTLSVVFKAFIRRCFVNEIL